MLDGKLVLVSLDLRARVGDCGGVRGWEGGLDPAV